MVFGHSVDARGNPVPQRVCSWPCFDGWAAYYVSHGHSVQPTMGGWGLAGVVLDPSAASRAMLLQARQYEVAERLEDAARTYEIIGMAKEAGDLRRRARTHTVTQVQVDVNALIEQVRRGGLTATFACPACGSPIPISGATSAAALRTCPACGSTIQTSDLARFLQRVVGA